LPEYSGAILKRMKIETKNKNEIGDFGCTASVRIK
jgi:hypothetical protein